MPVRVKKIDGSEKAFDVDVSQCRLSDLRARIAAEMGGKQEFHLGFMS
jgi:hypothetical protein